MLAIAILLSSAALITTFAWISVQFILNPYQVSWINKFLPEWAKISFNYGEHPQTLKQIQESLSKQELIAGKILPLNKNTTSAFLLPVFKQRSHCQSDCKFIVELRVYQLSKELEPQSASEKYYQLATQLPVTGPEESFVIAPVVDATDDNQGSSLSLPLNEIGRFESGTPSSGVWFYLQGHRQQGTSKIAYGYIVHYNPERTHLQWMLSWTSPNGHLPQWRQVTSGGDKELIVEQTVGLEPQLKIYQIKPVKFVLNPVELEAISLTPPALKNSGYEDALLLARSGLWTPAFEWLQSIKKQRKGRLPSAAQAQMDLIRLHSQLTKTQANTSWASPSQQVLADIIDGRWEKALQVFEASPQNAQEIATLLKSDGGRLWSRLEAQLRLNSKRQAVRAWGALIVAAKHGRERANSWLTQQSKDKEDSLEYFQSLIEQLNGEVPQSKLFATQQTSRIIGSLQPIAEIKPTEWLQPNHVKTPLVASLQKADNQWYQVQVAAFHDGKRWLYSPFTNLTPPKISPAKFFWEILSINSNPELQIVVWLQNGEQQTTTATIKAVQLQDGVLRLLVAVDETVETPHIMSLQQPPLALTNSALEWVEPSPVTFETLYQQNAPRIEAMLVTVWRFLQQSGQLPKGAIPETEQLLQKLGHWPVQEIDLTSNGKPETLLTISAEALASLYNSIDTNAESGFQLPNKNQARPRTLILSDSAQVIYTDFKSNSKQLLTAVAKLSAEQSLSLLVENESGYSLKTWSKKNQRFE